MHDRTTLMISQKLDNKGFDGEDIQEILKVVKPHLNRGFYMIVNGGSVPMRQRPMRVWTVLDQDSVNSGDPLRHHYNAFVEDSIHDWDWKDGVFKFYGHSSEKGETVLLVVEWEVSK